MENDWGPDETEALISFLTLVMCEVNPSIDEEVTYELVGMMLEEGTLDQQTALKFGRMIRESNFGGKQSDELH